MVETSLEQEAEFGVAVSVSVKVETPNVNSIVHSDLREGGLDDGQGVNGVKEMEEERT